MLPASGHAQSHRKPLDHHCQRRQDGQRGDELHHAGGAQIHRRAEDALVERSGGDRG